MYSTLLHRENWWYVIIDILSETRAIEHVLNTPRSLFNYMWRIAEQQVPNLSPGIKFSDIINHKDRICETKHIRHGHIGTPCYNSFRFIPSRLFICLPRTIRNITKRNVEHLKRCLNKLLKSIEDNPRSLNNKNSIYERLRWCVQRIDQKEW